MTVEPVHAEAAFRLGTEFGENYPEVWEDQNVFNRVASDHLNPPLNELGAEHGIAKYGETDAWTPEQLEYLMPYLQELAVIASHAAKSAMLLRRSMSDDGDSEPAGTRLTLLRNLAFREIMFSDGVVPKTASRHAEDLRKRPAVPEDEGQLQAVVTSRLERIGDLRVEEQRPPMPDAQPYGVSHEGAEHWCAAWMRHLGAHDAEVTIFAGDGGVDIVAQTSGWDVQVKNYAGSVSVTEVRELVGVSYTHGRKPMLLTSGTLTREAEVFAKQARVAVLQYNVAAGTLQGINERGKALRSDGFF